MKRFLPAFLILAFASSALAQSITGGGGGGSGGGSGTVTQIDTACAVSGGPITTTGTISGAAVIRAATGTTDTILSTDCGKVVTESNAAPVAITLPQATGSFTAPFFYTQVCLGVGTCTITPTTSTINGAATLVLTTGQSADIVSDGANYIAILGKGGAPTTNAADLTSGTLAEARLPAFTGDCTVAIGTSAIDCQPLYPQYIASNWYNAGGDRFTSQASSSTAGGATGRMNCYPAFVYGTATISSLGLRINTTSAGGLIQAAIYANNAATARPTGTPLASTASMSTTTAAAVNAAISYQVVGVRILWFCTNQDNSTATAFGIGSANFQIANMMGSATQATMLGAGPAAFAGVTTAKTFGTWDDISGATWAESGNAFPIVQFLIGSVP